MTRKYKILGKYIKDMSSETPDVETYLAVREQIAKYQLGIDIQSKALKNKDLFRSCSSHCNDHCPPLASMHKAINM